ncbi:MAG: hypothetical protein H0X26_04945 [Alphaproteobacteria bacterium]|nr:hypothetical protein [Alphaproteobacteria bacterium]
MKNKSILLMVVGGIFAANVALAMEEEKPSIKITPRQRVLSEPKALEKLSSPLSLTDCEKRGESFEHMIPRDERKTSNSSLNSQSSSPREEQRGVPAEGRSPRQNKTLSEFQKRKGLTGSLGQDVPLTKAGSNEHTTEMKSPRNKSPESRRKKSIGLSQEKIKSENQQTLLETQSESTEEIKSPRSNRNASVPMPRKRSTGANLPRGRSKEHVTEIKSPRPTSPLRFKTGLNGFLGQEQASFDELEISRPAEGFAGISQEKINFENQPTVLETPKESTMEEPSPQLNQASSDKLKNSTEHHQEELSGSSQEKIKSGNRRISEEKTPVTGRQALRRPGAFPAEHSLKSPFSQASLIGGEAEIIQADVIIWYHSTEINNYYFKYFLCNFQTEPFNMSISVNPLKTFVYNSSLRKNAEAYEQSKMSLSVYIKRCIEYDDLFCSNEHTEYKWVVTTKFTAVPWLKSYSLKEFSPSYEEGMTRYHHEIPIELNSPLLSQIKQKVEPQVRAENPETPRKDLYNTTDDLLLSPSSPIKSFTEQENSETLAK